MAENSFSKSNEIKGKPCRRRKKLVHSNDGNKHDFEKVKIKLKQIQNKYRNSCYFIYKDPAFRHPLIC